MTAGLKTGVLAPGRAARAAAAAAAAVTVTVRRRCRRRRAASDRRCPGLDALAAGPAAALAAALKFKSESRDDGDVTVARTRAAANTIASVFRVKESLSYQPEPEQRARRRAEGPPAGPARRPGLARCSGSLAALAGCHSDR